jgi:hypothetical protein
MAENTNEWADSILDYWKSEKIQLNPGCSETQINEAEEILNFAFPAAFKTLYLKVNGFANGDWTKNAFHIWSIDTILDEYNQAADKNFIGFTDFLIHCHQLGFVKDQIGIFNYNVFVAATFEETIQLIHDDSDLI